MSSPPTDIHRVSRRLPDALATRRLGEDVARGAAAGLVVLLDGPLGAGKTTLVQGFAAGIGASQPAASPSFVLAHHYAGGRFPVWHLDLYRIDREAAIDDLDLDLYMPRDGVALVEWAERAGSRWPADSLRIRLDLDGAGRIATIESARSGAGIATRIVESLSRA